MPKSLLTMVSTSLDWQKACPELVEGCPKGR